MPRQSRRAMLGNAAYVLAASASAIGITAGAAASVADLVPNGPTTLGCSLSVPRQRKRNV